MMNKIYFLTTSYTPNTAQTNRLMSFIKGFSELGIDVEVVFFLSDEKNSRVCKDFPHINFTYMWDIVNIKNRYFSQLAYSLFVSLFLRKVKKGDKIVLFDTQRVIFKLLNLQGVEVYAERTEHPFAFPVRTINMKRYVRSCKKLDGLFVISSALKDYFVECGCDPSRVHVINMTVDYNRFRGLAKQNRDCKYISYCGTATNNKDGVDILIQAFSKVVTKYPQYKLMIIGKGLTEDDISGNKKLIAELGIQESVIFTGVVDVDAMPQLLVDAEILALARPDNLQAQYGFPTKLGEYLLTSNPVVVTNVGDIHNFFQNKVDIILANPGDINDYADKLFWAIENPVLASQIGENGARVAMEKFNYLLESKKIANIIGYPI